MITQTCWCGKKFQAKEADVARGWAKSCCKSHAAKLRELRRTVRPGSRALARSDYEMHEAAMDDLECGWDGHKESF